MIPSAQESATIPRDHQQLLSFNQIVVEIHMASSRCELVGLVARSLPITLDAEQATWSEHGSVSPLDRIGSNSSGQDAIAALILARIASKQSPPSATTSQHAENSGANFGVYDVATLISDSDQLGGCEFPDITHRLQARHQIVTQFFVNEPHGVLLTAYNSRPFTAEQKFTLSLLRSHLAIAARRHYRKEPGPLLTQPISADPVLSRREQEVLPHLIKGFTNPEIANSLGISPRTVEKHVASILDKVGLDNRRMLIGLGSFSETDTTPPKNG